MAWRCRGGRALFCSVEPRPCRRGGSIPDAKIKVGEARAATSRAADGGEYERGAPIGLESRAQRVREFAADMAMQAYALLAAAHGAIDAYKDLTGEEWKAYEAPVEAAVEKKASAVQMGAFGS